MWFWGFQYSDRLGERACAGIRKYGVVGFRSRFSVGRFTRTGLVLQRFFDSGRILDGSVLSMGFPNFAGIIENWSDVEVLLDAHDAGLGVAGLVFVTDDGADIVGKREEICGCLAGGGGEEGIAVVCTTGA